MKPIVSLRAAACAVALCAGAAGAQEPVQQQPPGGDGARDEMIQLFQRVEKRLKEIDALLYDASAGESGLAPLAESGIGELLKRSQQKGQEVLEGIDRMLELAQQQRGQPQGGGQSQQDGEQQGSPLDQRPGGPTQREQTPQGPPQGQDQQGQQQGQQEQQGQPDSPRGSDAPARNEPAGAPPRQATGGPQPQEGNERWGDLPIHVRDLFRAEGGGDMPPQYRDWIDAYYRKLNQRP